MKKIFLCIAGLFLFAFSFSQWAARAYQIIDYVDDFNTYKVLKGDHLEKYFPNPMDQYLYPEFQNGDLKLNDGKLVTGGMYNLNFIKEELQFILNKDTLSFLKPQNVEYVRVSDKMLVFKWYRSKEVLYNGFFELICDGKYKLLNKKIGEFITAKPASALKDPVKAHYEFDERYYIVVCYYDLTIVCINYNSY